MTHLGHCHCQSWIFLANPAIFEIFLMYFKLLTCMRMKDPIWTLVWSIPDIQDEPILLLYIISLLICQHRSSPSWTLSRLTLDIQDILPRTQLLIGLLLLQVKEGGTIKNSHDDWDSKLVTTLRCAPFHLSFGISVVYHGEFSSSSWTCENIVRTKN